MKRIIYSTLLMCLLLVSCGRGSYKDFHDAAAYGTPRGVQRFLDTGWDTNDQAGSKGVHPSDDGDCHKRHAVAVAHVLLDGGLT